LKFPLNVVAVAPGNRPVTDVDWFTVSAEGVVADADPDPLPPPVQYAYAAIPPPATAIAASAAAARFLVTILTV
jgi:hypothetical protein